MSDWLGDLVLRDLSVEDLPVLFDFQRDPESVSMAAFTPEHPSDENAYLEKWSRIVGTDGHRCKTILVGDRIVGSAATFVTDGDTEVTYWVGREFWGRGIATRVLAMLIAQTDERPLFGRVAADNRGSARVLECNGFAIVGEETSFANGRNAHVLEHVYRLD